MTRFLEDVVLSKPIDVLDYISIDINGIPYKYTLKDDSPFDISTLVWKVNGIRKHSHGRALQFLKKYANGVKDIK